MEYGPSDHSRGLPHSSHWGAFSVLLRDQGIEVAPHPQDADPSALLGNIPASVSHPARIARPMVRRGWLEGGPGAIFGGSYGWASAGRFHDAQSQIHQFLNLAGGYVRSVGSYSSGAATVILPHILGPQGAVAGNNVSWGELVTESALVLAFGGMALKNNDVGGGGTSRHIAREQLSAARDRGVEFHLIGPLRDDLPAEKPGIEVGGAFRVRRAQVGPAQRPVDLRDPDSLTLVSLPQTKYCARRILNNRHAPSIHHIKRRSKNGATQLPGFRRSRICVIHRDVNHPMRRHAMRCLLGTQRASSGGIASLEFEDGIELIRTHRHVLGIPAEECVVELLRSGLVGGVKFNPAEGTGGVLIDVCHNDVCLSGKSLHQTGRRFVNEKDTTADINEDDLNHWLDMLTNPIQNLRRQLSAGSSPPKPQSSSKPSSDCRANWPR